MLYYNLSPKQLEEKAYEIVAQYDKERLTMPKRIEDIYSIIEDVLDVPYGWQYITPDQSILGITAFNPGYIWVWPEPKYYDGMMPYQVEVEKGEIVIDATLTENENRGRENFTVMHEMFHQILHKKSFRSMPVNYAHASTNVALARNGHKKLVTAIDIIEYQANFCAASFLMPREAVLVAYSQYFDRLKHHKFKSLYLNTVIDCMADEFSVSFTAMKYRMAYLSLIRKVKTTNTGEDIYEPIDI